MLLKVVNTHFYSHKHKQKYKFAIVYEAEVMAGLASRTENKDVGTSGLLGN